MNNWILCIWCRPGSRKSVRGCRFVEGDGSHRVLS
jgi:hypothetical protein